MSILLLFLLSLSVVTAVPIAGAISGSNGSLPFGKGVRSISFPNLSWYPDSTLTVQGDYRTFVVETAGPIFVSINGNISTVECENFTYLEIYRLNDNSVMKSWSMMANGYLSEVTSFYASENTWYQVQLNTCKGGKSSISGTVVSWVQPVSTVN